MNDEELYQVVLQALDEGMSPEEANQHIRRVTAAKGVAGGKGYPNIFALRMAIESSKHAEEADVLNEMADNPVRASIAGMAQGAVPFIDELIGASKSGEQLGPAMGRAHEARREIAPVETGLREIAGALMIPAVPGAAAVTRGPGMARTVMSAGARGGLFGAGTAAAFSAGMAPEGERLEAASEAAPIGGLFGAGLGAAGGAVAGVLRSGRGRGARVADRLVRSTGREIDEASKLQAGAQIAAEKTRIQTQLYQPIQRTFARVNDPGIQNFLRDLGMDPNLRTVVPRQFRGATNRLAGRQGTRTQASGILPSFEQLQAIRQSLRERAYTRAGDIGDREALARLDEMNELMGDAIGAPLREADAAWATASRHERLVDQGWTHWDSPYEDLVEMTRTLDPSSADFFNRGRLARLQAELTRGEMRGQTSTLRKLLDPDRDRRRGIALMFPGGEEGTMFQQFLSIAERERSQAALIDFISGSLRSGAIGVAGGAVAGTIAGRNN